MAEYAVCLEYEYLDSEIITPCAILPEYFPNISESSKIPRKGKHCLSLPCVTDENQINSIVTQTLKEVIRVGLENNAISVSADLRKTIFQSNSNVDVNNQPYKISVFYPKFVYGGLPVQHQYHLWVKCVLDNLDYEKDNDAILQTGIAYQQYELLKNYSYQQHMEHLKEQLSKATIINFCAAIFPEIIFAMKHWEPTVPTRAGQDTTIVEAINKPIPKTKKKSGRPRVSQMTIDEENEIANEWKDAKEAFRREAEQAKNDGKKVKPFTKAEFLENKGMTVKKLDHLLDRVDKRKKRSQSN